MILGLRDGVVRDGADGHHATHIKPVEFGHKAQAVDNDDGIVVDHTVEPGNPPDAPRLAPAIKRVIGRTGRTPHTVTADRGYGETISALKRGYGWDRTRIDTTQGARIWTGHGVLAHNLTKINVLVS